MKTTLILKSFSELPAPQFNSADASGLERSGAASTGGTTPGTSLALARWDPKKPVTETLPAVLGRMAPPQFHVN